MITRSPKNILIIDDDLFFRKKLSDIIQDMGHTTVLASSGKEAVAVMSKEGAGIDLVLLDLIMPDMSGEEVLEWMRTQGGAGRFPVMAISSRNALEVLEALRDLGVSGFIPKNELLPEQLVFRVNRALFPKQYALGERNRVPVSIVAVFSVNEECNTGILMNLSEGGGFLHTDLKLEEGMQINLTFYIENTLVDVKGVVRWSTPGINRENLFGGSGIRFTYVPWESQQRLSEFVAVELEKLDYLLNMPCTALGPSR